MIALRPASISRTPNSTSPFHPVMLTSASVATIGHIARGIRTASPEAFAIASRPSPAKGSVSARNVSGAISATPSLRIGQFAPHTSASTATGTSERPTLRSLTVLAQVQFAGLRDPVVAADAAVELGEPCVEGVDVALRPARDLAVRGDAELLQHALQHRPDADDELEVVRGAGTREQRRRRVVLDVDDDLPVARDVGARVGERGEERTAVLGEGAKLNELRSVGALAPGGIAATLFPDGAAAA